MKNKLLNALSVGILFLMPTTNFAQAPDLGTAANYVLFSSVGEVKNTGATFLTHLTGNVGTNSNATSPGFGNVDGEMTFTTESKSVQCANDLQLAYNSLSTATVTNFPSSPVLGNGQTLYAGVHSITSPSISLNLDLILDAQGNSNAVFIFKLQGAFSTNTNSKIKLINGAKACNVYWAVLGGAVYMGTGSTMRGTIITDRAIFIEAGDTLEGRALTITGAVTVSQLLGYTPIGCLSPVLNGPTAPVLGAAACYGLFSSAGSVSNTGTTYVTGDVGSNNSAPIGFNQINVTGKIRSPDGSTAQCGTDLLNAYSYINTLPNDITLLSPAEFGMNLVLTPHTYYMNSAATLTDTLYLNAEGIVNAVFVIKVNGALSTTASSKVKLINGAQSKNVYWMTEGVVNIGANSTFRGTMICNTSAIGLIGSGAIIDGRTLTTGGALTASAINVVATMIPGNCATLDVTSIDATNEGITIYPNPFSRSLNISVNNISQINNCELRLYNVLGAEIMNTTVTKQLNTLETSNLPSGIYFYKVIGNGKTIQSGKLISQ